MMLSIYEFLLHFCAIYAYQIWFDKNAFYWYRCWFFKLFIRENWQHYWINDMCQVIWHLIWSHDTVENLRLPANQGVNPSQVNPVTNSLKITAKIILRTNICTVNVSKLLKSLVEIYWKAQSGTSSQYTPTLQDTGSLLTCQPLYKYHDTGNIWVLFFLLNP